MMDAYYLYGWLAFHGIFLLNIGYSLYQLTYHYVNQLMGRNTGASISCIIYVSTLSFIIATAVCSIAFILTALYSIYTHLLLLIICIACNVQHCLSSCILCSRLHSVFLSTQFAISKLTILCWLTMLIAIVIALSFAIYIFPLQLIWTMVIPISYSLITIFDLFLTLTFLYKLIKAFERSSDEAMIDVISKITVLSTAHLIFTLICIISLFFNHSINTIALLSLSIETYLHWFTIVLSYRYWNSCYLATCKCCDVAFKCLFDQWVRQNNVIQCHAKMNRTVSATATSTATVSSLRLSVIKQSSVASINRGGVPNTPISPMSTQQSITESTCNTEYTPTPLRRHQSGTEQSEIVRVVITESQTNSAGATRVSSPIETQLETLDNILAVVKEMNEDDVQMEPADSYDGTETAKYLD